ncbi:hypothetical protein [Mucilaginibacter sp.]|uniref:hypothetical protein n=1 Tax=Mucilaginibacter sp. TaxID=1882438 RepID=UPI003D0AA409
MNALEKKIIELEERINDVQKQKSKPRKVSWYNRNLASITFFGYLAATIIGAISLILSYKFSKSTLAEYKNQDKLNQKQFAHIIKKDSQSDSTARVDKIHQDSLNKHQDTINREQLGYFKNQTLTGIEQLRYFKKQTLIAENQLNRAQIIYEEQQNENKPIFIFSQYKIDTIKNKAIRTITSTITNGGKRNAYVRKVILTFWNVRNNTIHSDSPPSAGIDLLPNSFITVMIPIDENVGFNEDTYVMKEVFYDDELLKGVQIFREFSQFRLTNGISSFQLSTEVQDKFLEAIKYIEKKENRKILTY